MYLTPSEKHWFIDVEADDLLEKATVVHVVCVKNAKTKEKKALVEYEEIKDFFARGIRDGCVFIGHNIIGFDAPVLNRLCGTRLTVSRLVDTLVLSYVYSPSLAGGHSLEAWGERIGIRKIAFNDFSRLSLEMIEYCERDVDLTEAVYFRLTDRMKQVGISERNCEIETKAWHLTRKQKKNGFAFDQPRAHQLYCLLRAEEKGLTDEIRKRFPPVLTELAHYKSANKGDGTPTKRYLDHSERFPKLEVQSDGSYKAFDYVEFNIGSPAQRVEKLLELGWTPREFTKITDKGGGGNPKVTEDGDLVPSLREFAEEADIPEVRLIADWIAINGRGNMINDWLNNYNEETGCIHGNLWLAKSLRYRHDKPNTANIPAVRIRNVDGKDQILRGRDGLWTYESRDLWVCRDPSSRRMVGVDAKGIQLRILAHYLEDDVFSEAILSEDPHTVNQQRMGLSTRALTKTITYATLMGAGDAKIANEAGVSLKEAKDAKLKFFATVPGLPRLIDRLKTELKRTGRITLCDGGRIMVPSDHMVIPYLLQGDESRIMKQAWIFVDEAVRKEKLDVIKVGDIHDEWQNDCLLRDVGGFLEQCRKGFAESGRSFNYRVPIDIDHKIGLSWAETH